MNTQNKRILIDNSIKPKHPTEEDHYIKDCIEQGLFLDNKAIEFFKNFITRF